MYKYLIYILLIASPYLSFSQDMLIEQIAGKEVVRQSFNTAKELTSKQVFQVGQLQTKGNQLVVRVEVSLFDEDLELTDKYITKYTCEPDESDVLLTVFPFARKGDAEYVIEASSTGFKKLYYFSADAKKLEDLSLEMSVESGILSFFGSKNILSLTERRLHKNDSGYTLQSQMTIEAYLWGLKVKTIRYQVTEKLDQNRTLLSQVFIDKDGSYFLVDY